MPAVDAQAAEIPKQTSPAQAFMPGVLINWGGMSTESA